MKIKSESHSKTKLKQLFVAPRIALVRYAVGCVILVRYIVCCVVRYIVRCIVPYLVPCVVCCVV